MEQTNQSGAPVAPKAVKAKTSKTVIAGMAICAAFAVAGAVFSGYALMKMSGEKKTADTNTTTTTTTTADNKTTDGTTTKPTTETVTVDAISKEAAQNIIAPYIKSQTYLKNVFDVEFNDDSKFAIAVQNLDPTNSGIYDNRLYYSEVDRSAKELFGNDYTLPSKDYNMAGWQFKIKEGGTDNAIFEGQLYGIGGMGYGMVNTVKDATIDSDNLIINVYHYVTTICSFNDEDPLCIDRTNSDGYYSLALAQADEAAYIEKYADQLPIYTMTFAKENGHYILKNVEKL